MKPSIPQGTRDFDNNTLKKRQYIVQCIAQEFILHGFEALETPAFELLETLMGKYGDEGDKLIFKILNNGLEKKEKQDILEEFNEILDGKNNSEITQRALKYDLTIPFARYVAMQYGQLSMPYKRYQIQNVWRADRPQKGRYREFTQCDADVIGSPSLLNEVELLEIYQKVFAKLKIEIGIQVNHRKIFNALAEKCGSEKWMHVIAMALDKYDKIGEEKVLEEMQSKGMMPEHIQIVKAYLNSNEIKNNIDKLFAIEKLLSDSQAAQIAIQELKFIYDAQPKINFDFSLARGLDYYTGCIIEIKPLNVQMGSIGGGGRYDNLTALFGLKDVTGVGISFGLDRIYDVLEMQQLFPENILQNQVVFIANLDAHLYQDYKLIAAALQKENIACMLYPETKKMDKQMKYAHKKNMPFVILYGENEKPQEKYLLKNMVSGEQQLLTMQELINAIKK